VEVCALCGVTIAGGHPHLVDVETRGLICACPSCHMLFDRAASSGRFRAVPSRYLYLPKLALDEGQWERLDIPVAIAFFFRNSYLDRPAAFYPSPAGATESLLEPDLWESILQANPPLRDMAPDVEALLLYKREPSFESYIAPISVCYELVGRLRGCWRGFYGGREAWAEIDSFFAGLRQRSRVLDGPATRAEDLVAAALAEDTAPPAGTETR
jgi:hypothetical protein